MIVVFQNSIYKFTYGSSGSHSLDIHGSVHDSDTHDFRRLQTRELAELVVGFDMDLVTPTQCQYAKRR